MIALRGNQSLRSRLERWGPTSIALFASATSFAVYFCMYAFRKPFAVATYAGYEFANTGIELKTALVLSQLFGYVASKYIGVKFCSQLPRERLMAAMILLILFAECALLGFAIAPSNWKVVALFCNGLPLGMIWGLAMRYLEGRRTTEFLVATLSFSYIASTGFVKDVGRCLLDGWGVDPFWMPFCVGALFLPPVLLSIWLLDAVPAPDLQDEAERSKRTAMTGSDQWAFLAHFSFGLIVLTLAYILLTAFRDFRDNYAVEILNEIKLAKVPGIFTKIELVIAVVVTLTLAGLSFFRRNRNALLATFSIMTLGTLMLGAATLLWQAGWLSGLAWMILVGLGAYLAYVPYTVLFERIFAVTRASGSSVFAIYLIDSGGYTGSAAMQLYKDLWHAETSRLHFFVNFSLALSIIGFAMLLFSGWYFICEEQRTREAGILADVASTHSLPCAAPDAMPVGDEEIA
ncbi:DUF5690 family protein [Blastopirellula marina]|uniref:Uncharacterized conserved membrane protein, probable transporter n=1 Tax=Blastopirellula marina DSM 3645 TaxID=314230 RepID=A3ZSV9_9BACT|nr:DUF5690 family protein [Blastopirellula marina]EAQ80384.1 Uncharacterized conserved membrane protein, probable transporter [Blastopirellula marina DSM 3645]